MTTELMFSILDLVGTFVFALSGAEAAKERELDLFGIIIVSFLTACGGGIIRDICLGIFPPVGISYWPYLMLTLLATLTVASLHRFIVQIKYPVLLFDAVGLSMFSVAGTQKALFHGQNYEVAILLGVLSAIGGGIIREILLGRIPVVLRREVYGSAALIGSIIVVLFHYFKLDQTFGAWIAITACFLVRYLSIKNKWNLPRF
jgi:uncharacterized membrane protein YeiH